MKTIAEWICLIIAWVLIRVWPIVGMMFALRCDNFFHGPKKVLD